MVFPRLEEIRERRLALDISLKKFAQMVGTKPSFLSQIETRKANPNFELLEKIFFTLDQEASKILGTTKTVGYLSKKFVSVSPDETIIDAVSKMSKKHFSQLPVMSNSKCVGLITERSTSKFLADNIGSLDGHVSVVKDLMDFPPPIIDSNYVLTPLLMNIISDHDCIIISDKGVPTSILTKIDVSRNLIKK